MKDEFDQAQIVRPAPETRERPEPEELIAKGITTPETLDHMAQRLPPVPHPEPSPDDPAGWRTAIANADAEHEKRIGGLRERFEKRFEKSRADFGTAQTLSPQDRGQVRGHGRER